MAITYVDHATGKVVSNCSSSSKSPRSNSPRKFHFCSALFGEGLPADLCRKYGISDSISYNWKAKYGGMVNLAYTISRYGWYEKKAAIA
ncbi:hypothetical protein [Brucella anthropi]|uniref:hypothetical protein n=1 Tax=Brucella anthropi TaxID=529 RepID=UPI0011847CF3|nr:hypothetical protein [Brucella anthropi]